MTPRSSQPTRSAYLLQSDVDRMLATRNVDVHDRLDADADASDSSDHHHTRTRRIRRLLRDGWSSVKCWVLRSMCRLQVESVHADSGNGKSVRYKKLGWFYFYDWRQSLLRDFQAGIEVGLLTIPQGLSYGILAGLAPEHGLYSATLAPCIYAVFGTSNYVNIGPFAIISFLVHDLIGDVFDSETDPAAFKNAVLISTIMSGLMLVVLGTLRLPLAEFLPKPLMSGLTTGGAFLIAQSQIRYLLGIPNVPRGAFFQTFANIFSEISATGINWRDVLISLISLTILLGIDVLNKRKKWSLPGSLIAMIPTTMIVYFSGWHGSVGGVRTIGEIPQGFPAPNITMISAPAMANLVVPSGIIAIVGYALTISTGKALLEQQRQMELMDKITSIESNSPGTNQYKAVSATLETTNERQVLMDNDMDGSPTPVSIQMATMKLSDDSRLDDRGQDGAEQGTGQNRLREQTSLEATETTSTATPAGRRKEIHEEFELKIDSNQEFLALGFANVIGALVGGFHSFSSLSRSALALKSHAQSPMYNISAALLVIITITVLSPLVRPIPYSVLGSIIVVALLGLLKQIKEPLLLWRKSNISDLCIWLFTFLGCLVFSTVFGLLLGCVVSIGSLLRVVSHPKLVIMDLLDHGHRSILVETDEHSPVINGLFAKYPNTAVVRFCGPLLFCNAEAFQERIREIVKRSYAEIERHRGDRDGNARDAEGNLYLVIDLSLMHALDSIGLETLQNLKPNIQKMYPMVHFIYCNNSQRQIPVRLSTTVATLTSIGKDEYTQPVYYSIEDCLHHIEQFGARDDDASATLS